MYHEAKVIVYTQKITLTKYIRVYVGINMGVQILLLIIDQKVFRVMSAYYRTCRVTHLTVISLLSTRC